MHDTFSVVPFTISFCLSTGTPLNSIKRFFNSKIGWVSSKDRSNTLLFHFTFTSNGILGCLCQLFVKFSNVFLIPIRMPRGRSVKGSFQTYGPLSRLYFHLWYLFREYFLWLLSTYSGRLGVFRRIIVYEIYDFSIQKE